eukprot:sb/3461379/
MFTQFTATRDGLNAHYTRNHGNHGNVTMVTVFVGCSFVVVVVGRCWLGLGGIYQTLITSPYQEEDIWEHLRLGERYTPSDVHLSRIHPRELDYLRSRSLELYNEKNTGVTATLPKDNNDSHEPPWTLAVNKRKTLLRAPTQIKKKTIILSGNHRIISSNRPRHDSRSNTGRTYRKKLCSEEFCGLWSVEEDIWEHLRLGERYTPSDVHLSRIHPRELDYLRSRSLELYNEKNTGVTATLPKDPGRKSKRNNSIRRKTEKEKHKLLAGGIFQVPLHVVLHIDAINGSGADTVIKCIRDKKRKNKTEIPIVSSITPRLIKRFGSLKARSISPINLAPNYGYQYATTDHLKVPSESHLAVSRSLSTPATPLDSRKLRPVSSTSEIDNATTPFFSFHELSNKLQQRGTSSGSSGSVNSEQGSGGSEGTMEVPRVIQNCCQFILQHGLDQEGIFRKCGSIREVRTLRAEFNTTSNMTVRPDTSIHVVAGLVKEFLKELPEALLTRALYYPFLHCTKLEDLDTRLEGYRELIRLLPAANRDTLQYLLQFFKIVSEHSQDSSDADGLPHLVSKTPHTLFRSPGAGKGLLRYQIEGNKMNTRNLATVIGPNILHRRKRAGASESKSNLANEAWEAPQAIEVVEELIIHNDDLFMVDSDVRKEVLKMMHSLKQDHFDSVLNEYSGIEDTDKNLSSQQQCYCTDNDYIPTPQDLSSRNSTDTQQHDYYYDMIHKYNGCNSDNDNDDVFSAPSQTQPSRRLSHQYLLYYRHQTRSNRQQHSSLDLSRRGNIRASPFSSLDLSRTTNNSMGRCSPLSYSSQAASTSFSSIPRSSPFGSKGSSLYSGTTTSSPYNSLPRRGGNNQIKLDLSGIVTSDLLPTTPITPVMTPILTPVSPTTVTEGTLTCGTTTRSNKSRTRDIISRVARTIRTSKFRSSGNLKKSGRAVSAISLRFVEGSQTATTRARAALTRSRKHAGSSFTNSEESLQQHSGYGSRNDVDGVLHSPVGGEFYRVGSLGESSLFASDSSGDWHSQENGSYDLTPPSSPGLEGPRGLGRFQQKPKRRQITGYGTQMSSAETYSHFRLDRTEQQLMSPKVVESRRHAMKKSRRRQTDV